MGTLLYLAIPLGIAVAIYLGLKARKKAKPDAGGAGDDGPRFDFSDGDSGGGGD